MFTSAVVNQHLIRVFSLSLFAFGWHLKRALKWFAFNHVCTAVVRMGLASKLMLASLRGKTNLYRYTLDTKHWEHCDISFGQTVFLNVFKVFKRENMCPLECKELHICNVHRRSAQSLESWRDQWRRLTRIVKRKTWRFLSNQYFKTMFRMLKDLQHFVYSGNFFFLFFLIQGPLFDLLLRQRSLKLLRNEHMNFNLSALTSFEHRGIPVIWLPAGELGTGQPPGGAVGEEKNSL